MYINIKRASIYKTEKQVKLLNLYVQTQEHAVSVELVPINFAKLLFEQAFAAWHVQ